MLADASPAEQFDVMLAITRGGMVPAGMLAYRLRLRDILVAAVEYYDDTGQPGPRPTFFQFPADPLLRGKRVLDRRRGLGQRHDDPRRHRARPPGRRRAGHRRAPLQAGALASSPARPDVHAVETDRWVVYPFKAGSDRRPSSRRRSVP